MEGERAAMGPISPAPAGLGPGSEPTLGLFHCSPAGSLLDSGGGPTGLWTEGASWVLNNLKAATGPGVQMKSVNLSAGRGLRKHPQVRTRRTAVRFLLETLLGR